MSPEEKKTKCCCYHSKAFTVILGLCAIALGLIFLAQYHYNPDYNISRLWPVFPIIAGIGITITAIFSRKK